MPARISVFWLALLLLWTFFFTPPSATASRSEVHFLPSTEQRETALGVRFDHYNGRGDVVSQTDGAGATQWEAAYEAYGKRVREVGTTKDRQKANTKDEDPTGEMGSGDKKEMEMSVVRNSFPFFRLTPFPLWVGAW